MCQSMGTDMNSVKAHGNRMIATTTTPGRHNERPVAPPIVAPLGRKAFDVSGIAPATGRVADSYASLRVGFGRIGFGQSHVRTGSASAMLGDPPLDAVFLPSSNITSSCDENTRPAIEIVGYVVRALFVHMTWRFRMMSPQRGRASAGLVQQFWRESRMPGSSVHRIVMVGGGAARTSACDANRASVTAGVAPGGNHAGGACPHPSLEAAAACGGRRQHGSRQARGELSGACPLARHFKYRLGEMVGLDRAGHCLQLKSSRDDEHAGDHACGVPAL